MCNHEINVQSSDSLPNKRCLFSQNNHFFSILHFFKLKRGLEGGGGGGGGHSLRVFSESKVYVFWGSWDCCFPSIVNLNGYGNVRKWRINSLVAAMFCQLKSYCCTRYLCLL